MRHIDCSKTEIRIIRMQRQNHEILFVEVCGRWFKIVDDYPVDAGSDISEILEMIYD